MKPPLTPANEKRRLEVLGEYGILDTPPEEVFDEIVRLVARLCDAPMAAMAMVDDRRLWLKARTGIDLPEVPREFSFCGHAIRQQNLFEICNATEDERFVKNPFVAESPRIRFYAGVPLVSPEGFPIGTLHVLDQKPRELTEDHREVLQVFARDIMAHLNLRRLSPGDDQSEAKSFRDGASMRTDFDTLVEAVPHMIWGALPDGALNFFNQQCLDYLGRSYEEMKGWGWEEVIHVDDLPRTHELWSRSLRTGEPYDTMFRIRRAEDAEYRWHLTRALPVRDRRGKIVRWYGTCTEVHDRKDAEQRLEEKARERTLELESSNKRLSEEIALRRETEESLRQSETQFRELAENINEVFWLSSSDKQETVYVSSAYETIWGRSRNELCSDPEAWLAGVHPDDVEWVREAAKKIPDTLEYDVRYRIVRPDGSIRWIRDRAFPVRDQSGKVRRIAGLAEDVTCHYEVERLLRDEIGRREAIFDALPANIALVDRNGTILAVNESWRRFAVANVFPDGASGVGVNYLKVCDSAIGDWSEEAGEAAAGIRQVLDGRRGSFSLEYPCHSPDEKRWFRLMATPLHEGRQDGAVIMHIDISERRIYEEQLRLKSGALAAAANAIFITDRGGRIEWVNAAFVESSGYSESEAIGRRPEELLKSNQQDKEFYETMWNTILSGETWRGEIINRRKDGSLYTEEMTITPMLDDLGAITHFIAVKQDITERKRIGEQLQVSEQRYRSLVDGARDLIFTLSPSGELLSMNPAFESIGGLVTEEWIGRSYLHLVHPEDAERANGVFARVTQGEIPPVFELRILAADGKHIPMEFTVTPQWRGDELIGVLGIGRDIRERKHLEEQVRQAQKLDSIGQLAAGIAHDFNNLLTIQQGYLSLIAEDGNLEPEFANPLKEVSAAAERAAQLTRQLLLFSRKQETRFELLDVGDVVEGMTKMLGRIVGEDIGLEVERHPELPDVEADRGMLEQVVMNLAVNARDAMPEGGSLSIRAEMAESAAPPEAALNERSVRCVCIKVEDTGTGITPGDLERIYEPFFTTKETGKGVGLGLSTVYGIVRRHHGWIKVKSKPRTGTSFCVFLPVAEDKAGMLESETTLGTLERGSETILVVEDEPAVRGMLDATLRQLGYKVLCAGSGPDAIELWKAEGEPVDLLITDLVMPGGMTGYELADVLKARSPDMKIICTSGYAPETTESRKVGRRHFLQKPYAMRDLAAVVRRCLDD